MKWVDIKKQYPNKFILIGDIVEERISENEPRVISLTNRARGYILLTGREHFGKTDNV